MRKAAWAALALVATGIAGSASAQQVSASYAFLKAVRDANGADVTRALQDPVNAPQLVNTRDPSSGEAPLHIVVKRRDITYLNFLAARGARVEQRDNAGNTPLYLAAQLGWTDGVTALLMRRAQVDAPGANGETPLTRAVANRDLATVRLLLLNGADPNRTDRASGLTPRDMARRDPRAGLILRAIEDAKPRPKSAIGPN